MPRPTHISGPAASTAHWRTYSSCRTGVAVSVAGVIEPALQAAEIRRSAARPTTDLSAYDLYLRALAAFHQFTRERVFRSSGIARTGDRDRSALRAGAFLGGDLPPEARQRRLGRRAGDIPPQGHGSCSAGAPGVGE